ncbi:MAG: R2-like ligand-binding oxidase [Ardenticatenaceae bacterium]
MSVKGTFRDGFATTTRGLDRQSPPYRLYQKAKRLGVWNPDDIDFSQDRADWEMLNEGERDWVKQRLANFIAGEEAVTLDLLPLIKVVAMEGRVEEEMFLTTFLFEEGKHMDFFTRYVEEVMQIDAAELGTFHSAPYKEIFHKRLPEALQALEEDPSPLAQVRASTIYNMFVEGVAAEAGYNSWFMALRGSRNLLPGMQEGITLIKRDESRHIGFGVYFLSRHIVADPSMLEVVEGMLEELMPLLHALQDSGEDRDQANSFEFDYAASRAFTNRQYQKRIKRIQRAKGATMESLYKWTNQIIEDDDG